MKYELVMIQNHKQKKRSTRKAFLEKAVVKLVYKWWEDLPLKTVSRSLKYDSIFVKSYYILCVHIIRTGDAKKQNTLLFY